MPRGGTPAAGADRRGGRRASPCSPSWSCSRCCGSPRWSGRRAAGPRPVLGRPGSATAVRNTVVLAVAVTVAAVPLGVALALVLRRPDLPGRAFWQAAVLLPVLVPDFVLGYSWTQAYARAGFTDTLLGAALGRAARPGRGVAGAGRERRAAGLPRRRRRAGRPGRARPRAGRPGLGRGQRDGAASRSRCRWLLPAVAAAGVLVFVLTLGTFAIPQVLGAPAGFDTVTTRIYADLSLGGDPASFVEAVTLALLLVLVAAACVAPADALLGPRLRATRPADTQAGTGGARDGAAVRAGSGRRRWPSTCSSPWRCRWPPWCWPRSPAPSGVPPTPGNWSAGPLPAGAHPAHLRGARPQRRPGRRRGDPARRARRAGRRARAAARPGGRRRPCSRSPSCCPARRWPSPC